MMFVRLNGPGDIRVSTERTGKQCYGIILKDDSKRTLSKIEKEALEKMSFPEFQRFYRGQYHRCAGKSYR